MALRLGLIDAKRAAVVCASKVWTFMARRAENEPGMTSTERRDCSRKRYGVPDPPHSAVRLRGGDEKFFRAIGVRRGTPAWGGYYELYPP